ncbi:hypothetical protein G3T36_10645 [Diaminobutyricibacter tongyongensis]|uniref:Uncharacterized protein n=1 Tax=Leifsonia tongyongensis TaxID=1268043 RepID=A0A6L9XZ80_9MICO|nr:hypothetical protein [Diaminobutyricibacter tongyongensis]NEN06334.1 hypothetical protein [Diaminobutyricibacter tongyongensis]
MTNEIELDDVDRRVQEFAKGCLDALTPERRAECEVLSVLDEGMRLRPAEDDPDVVELLWGGAVIGVTTWAWLNTGETPEGGA